MDRRALLHALGATAALGFIPRSAEGAEAFVNGLRRAAAGQPGFRTLTPAQQGLVARVADLVLPRTDTPGALDVGVPALIDLLLTEWYDAKDRDAFLAGIDAMEERGRRAGGPSFTGLAEAQQVTLLRELDADRQAKAGAAFGFRELKALVIFGYFTSERVTKDILQERMVFPRYQGDAVVTS